MSRSDRQSYDELPLKLREIQKELGAQVYFGRQGGWMGIAKDHWGGW